MHEIMIGIGAFYFGRGDERLNTLLGSCVAIALWHPQQRYGGLCHYVLPADPGQNPGKTSTTMGSNTPLNGRYADQAMQLFARCAGQYGTPLVEYQSMVFGGSRMYQTKNPKTSSAFDVGQQNIEAAQRLLQEFAIPIVNRHVGGQGFRRVSFSLADGTAEVRQLAPDSPFLAFPSCPLTS